MARPRKTDRWEHPVYKIGFCLPIRGTVYTEINAKRKTTGLRWDEANMELAIEILTTRIEEYLGKTVAAPGPHMPPPVLQPTPQLPIPQPTALQPVTPFATGYDTRKTMLLDAITVFVRQNLQDVSDNVLQFYRLTFTHYFWRDHPLDDYNGIVDMMSLSDDETWAKAHRRKHLKLSTRRKRIQYARLFFDWCIERQWCDKNPANARRMPKLPEPEPNPFEPHEVRLLIDYFIAHGKREMALLVEFIAITACRIMEALGILWVDIDEEDIHINGKGDRPRVFPRHMVGFERLEVILAEAYKNKERNGGRLWLWTERNRPAVQLAKACKDLGLGRGRSWHSLRKAAEDWWEEELGLPDRTITDLAGHTLAVRRKHYRRKRNASQIRSAVAKAATMREAGRQVMDDGDVSVT